MNLEDKKVIGHVGRFNPQKNHGFLIDIFNEIHKKDENTVLLLIGDGYLKNEMEKKVHGLKLIDCVRFLGSRSDIPDLMQAMDLFLFPSLYEGLAVVLVEAQAAGLQCITSTGVTKESDVTGNVKFLNIKQSPLLWASEVLKTDMSKKNVKNILINKGYDASTNVKVLNKFYMKSY